MSGPQGLLKAAGKVPSRQNEPVAHGFYQTPAEATLALAIAEEQRLRGLPALWDPGVGMGGIVDPLASLGYRTLGSDLVVRWSSKERPNWWHGDLFAAARLPEPDAGVICNPPFDLISPRNGDVPWVRHLLDLGAPYVAMLAPATWTYATSRRAFLDRYSVARMAKVCWRLDWTGKGSPPQSHAWFIWDKAHEGPTEVHRLYKPSVR